MARYLNSLTVGGLPLTPTFTQEILAYSTNSKVLKQVISATTQNMGDFITILRTNDDKVYSSTSTISNEWNLLLGENNFVINVTDVVGEIGTNYSLKVVYTPSSGKYPIYEHNLSPGFYGGTYIPNYRLLRELYTCGSGDKDFEGDYATKEPMNEQAIKYLNEVVNLYTRAGKLDAICESFVHYSGFVNTNWPNDGDYRYYLPLIQVELNKPTTLINGFKPKNNKLFAYPFSTVEIQGYGQNSELKYESFNKGFKFAIVSKFLAGASILVYPINYEGVLDNYDNGCTGDNLPIMGYTKDSFMNEYNAGQNSRTQSQIALRQNRDLANLSTSISAIGGVISSAGLGSSFGGGAGSALSVGGVITNAGNMATGYLGNNLQYNQGMMAMAAELKDASARPSSITNQNASPAIPAAMKDGVVPYVVNKSIRYDFAKKIDLYFTKYGYKTSSVEVPNIRSRPAFNFLKCFTAYVSGDLNQTDILEIKSVLEHGITFWHTTDVGNYNLNNDATIK